MTDQVLFISICTRQKKSGGLPLYDKTSAITTKLSPEHQNRLLKMRDTIRSRLKTLEFDGFQAEEENEQLQKALDFGGSSSDTVVYRPAIDRYDGRFYNSVTGLEVKDQDNSTGKERIVQKGYHLLILSALYGILDSHEPIQYYSCPIDHKSLDIQKIWRQSNVISDAIVDYIKFQSSINNIQIKRVYDLTVLRVYRDLVDWQYVYQKTGVEIVHVFHKKLAGDKVLEKVAAFFRDYLLEHSLQDLLAHNPDEEIQFTGEDIFILSSRDIPPKGYARESIGYERDSTKNDKIIDQYNSAYQAFIEAVSALRQEDHKKMKDAVDTGAKKIGVVLQIALQVYLNSQHDDFDQLIRDFQANDKAAASREEVARLHYYRKVRNIAAHDHYSSLWELGGQIQYARMFLINRLDIHSGILKDPYDVIRHVNEKQQGM